MDFLTSKIKPMYFKYLTAAFGSALISSIYGVVDMAMVGQYQGPSGTGGACRGCSYLEYHIQFRSADGHWRQCAFQHIAGKIRGKQKGIQ